VNYRKVFLLIKLNELMGEDWFSIFVQQGRVEGNLYAREWYLALNNRGDRHFHSDYEFLREGPSVFPRESSFRRLSRNDGKLRPVVYTAGKVAFPPRDRERKNLCSKTCCDDQSRRRSLREIIEIPVADAGCECQRQKMLSI